MLGENSIVRQFQSNRIKLKNPNIPLSIIVDVHLPLPGHYFLQLICSPTGKFFPNSLCRWSGVVSPTTRVLPLCHFSLLHYFFPKTFIISVMTLVSRPVVILKTLYGHLEFLPLSFNNIIEILSWSFAGLERDIFLLHGEGERSYRLMKHFWVGKCISIGKNAIVRKYTWFREETSGIFREWAGGAAALSEICKKHKI